MNHQYDDAVVGAGILGLAHAYHLARRGRRVAVWERSPRAIGASVRNFGMLWPIGQPVGPRLDLARRSRIIWLDILRASGIWNESTGSMHVAYQDDEAQVLKEFQQIAEAGDFPVSILDPNESVARSPMLRRKGLKRTLYSEHEVCVDPRSVLAELPNWLASQFGVEFHFRQTVTSWQAPQLKAGGGEWSASRLWICAGDDLQTLYPGVLSHQGGTPCKLQMMRTAPVGLRLGPMLAGGLTLKHYSGFADCPSLPALRERLLRDYPLYDRFGIHVLVSQTAAGELTLGDSHIYGDDIEPFDSAEIDDLVLRYLNKFLSVPDLKIASRWHGVYVNHPSEPWTVVEPDHQAVAVTGVGGAGMTLSFGLAEVNVKQYLGESV